MYTRVNLSSVISIFQYPGGGLKPNDGEMPISKCNSNMDIIFLLDTSGESLVQ